MTARVPPAAARRPIDHSGRAAKRAAACDAFIRSRAPRYMPHLFAAPPGAWLVGAEPPAWSEDADGVANGLVGSLHGVLMVADKEADARDDDSDPPVARWAQLLFSHRVPDVIHGSGRLVCAITLRGPALTVDHTIAEDVPSVSEAGAVLWSDAWAVDEAIADFVETAGLAPPPGVDPRGGSASAIRPLDDQTPLAPHGASDVRP